MNANYSDKDFEMMGAVLRLIIKRAEKGLQYGPDMKSSRAVAFQYIAELADWKAYTDQTARLGGK